jgi:hypothetical protein
MEEVYWALNFSNLGQDVGTPANRIFLVDEDSILRIHGSSEVYQVILLISDIRSRCK